jgi:hypothetical protein
MVVQRIRKDFPSIRSIKTTGAGMCQEKNSHTLGGKYIYFSFFSRKNIVSE